MLYYYGTTFDVVFVAEREDEVGLVNDQHLQAFLQIQVPRFQLRQHSGKQEKQRNR